MADHETPLHPRVPYFLRPLAVKRTALPHERSLWQEAHEDGYDVQGQGGSIAGEATGGPLQNAEV